MKNVATFLKQLERNEQLFIILKEERLYKIMFKLKPISYDPELTEFNLEKQEPCNDRLITELHLEDYDWMTYEFKTFLPTKKQGILNVNISYFGTISSVMVVKQITKDDENFIHTIYFDSDIFIAFLIKYMTQHIKQWDSKYAFCGEELAIELFNNILAKATDYTISEDYKISERFK